MVYVACVVARQVCACATRPGNGVRAAVRIRKGLVGRTRAKVWPTGPRVRGVPLRQRLTDLGDLGPRWSWPMPPENFELSWSSCWTPSGTIWASSGS
ncbi:hypothetical protein SCALM49S_06442 [Streptomyces californicus]